MGNLILDSDKSCSLDLAEVSQGDIPLDAGPVSVLGLQRSDRLSGKSARTGEPGYRAFTQLESVDGGISSPGVNGLVAVNQGVGVLDKVVDSDGDTVVDLDELAEAVLIGLHQA